MENDVGKDIERSVGDVVVGSVARWSVRGGYGFIKPDDGGKTLFCHMTNLKTTGEFGAIDVDTRVRCTLEKREDKMVVGECTAEDGEDLPGFADRKSAIKILHKKAVVNVDNEELEACSDLCNKRVKAREELKFVEADSYRELMNGKGCKVYDTLDYWVSKDGRKWFINLDGTTELREVVATEDTKLEIRLWMNKNCSGKIIGDKAVHVKKMMTDTGTRVFFLKRDRRSAQMGEKMQECKVQGTPAGIASVLDLMFKAILDLIATTDATAEELFESFEGTVAEGALTMGMIVPEDVRAYVEEELKPKFGERVWVAAADATGCNTAHTGTPEQVTEGIMATVRGVSLDTWLPGLEKPSQKKLSQQKKRKKASSKKQQKKKDQEEQQKNQETQQKKGRKGKRPSAPKRQRRAYGEGGQGYGYGQGQGYGYGQGPIQPYGYAPAWGAAPPARSGPSEWEKFYDMDGVQYYRNLKTGETHY